MYKLFLLFISSIIALSSCENKKHYELHGFITGKAYEGKNVYILEKRGKEKIRVDSTTIKNGKFYFQGYTDSTLIRFVVLDKIENSNKAPKTLVVLESGQIHIKFDSLITVNGTKLNNAYTLFRENQQFTRNKLKPFSRRHREALKLGTLTDSLQDQIFSSYKKIYDALKQEKNLFIEKNMGNRLGEFLFEESIHTFSDKTIEKLLYLADESYKSQPRIQHISKFIKNKKKVAIGKKFIDFTLKSPNGESISISEITKKNKIVLIDFWAAWCKPCIAEVPSLADAYKKYKRKGFEIVSISLDKDSIRWTQKIRELNMDWVQLSDLRSWESPIVELYAFNAIPHTVLLDKNGIIIAKNLRGEDILDTLNELLVDTL